MNSRRTRNRDDRRATAVGATVAGAGTGGTLIGITAGLSGPVANLGGYATAQIVASAIGGGSLGVGGPALAVGVALVGGPVVAGAIVTVAAAGLVGGAVLGVRRLFW